MNKLADRMARINRVQNRTEALLYLQKHDLVAAHAYLSIENPSGNIPYHNNDHALTVVKWCGRLDSMLTPTENTCVRGMLLGATFHDFRHSGGQRPDTDNVSDALDALVQFANIHKRSFKASEIDVAMKCIECTVFPFTVEPVGYEPMIIRDADILQSIDIDFENILGDQLRKEIIVSRGENITRKQFAEGELAFLETVQMYTEPGKVLWAAAKPVLVERFTEIAAGR